MYAFILFSFPSLFFLLVLFVNSYVSLLIWQLVLS